MNIKKFTKPTKENLLFMGALGIFGFLFYSHAITQELFLLFSGLMAAIYSRAAGSKYEISMPEAEALALNEVEQRQLTHKLPAGTLYLSSETTLTTISNMGVYIVSITISALSKKFIYLVKVGIYGTVIGIGRSYERFSAIDDVKQKIPETIKETEKVRDVGVPPEGQEKVNTNENQ